MDTYIINLETSSTRREYMEHLFSPYSFFNINFISAVDGRKMVENEKEKLFDEELCVKRYGRILNAGEIGCTLSHRKCYEKLLLSSNEYALILEDDIAFIRDVTELQNINIEKKLKEDKPLIVLLSGDYWFFKKKKILSVFDAVGSYAYLINKKAASLILSIDKPYNVADDWILYKRLGVKLYALYPYFMDANINMEELSSDIKQDNWGIDRRLMGTKHIINSYITGAIKKGLKLFGHFEAKIRIINNKRVN